MYKSIFIKIPLVVNTLLRVTDTQK